MKYVVSLLITGFLLVFMHISCNDPVSTTASYIQILSKKLGTFTMTIPEENLWNIIQVNQIYFATYEYTDINKKVELVSINYPT